MAMQGHMWIEGKKQGKIEGPNKQKGREKSFDILAFRHEVSLPFDQTTGQATGKRVHSPFIVLKTIDEASPKLMKALTSGEHLTVELKLYRPSPMGGAAEQHYYTVKMENAMLTSIKDAMDNVLETRGTALGHNEHLAFIYDKIAWTFQGGGEHIDEWSAPYA